MPDRLVTEALRQAGLAGARTAPVAAESRNEVWHVEDGRSGLALKLQMHGASAPTIEHEAEVLRRLAGQPGVPALRAAGTVGGVPFVVTEMLPGVPLRTRLGAAEAEPLLAELAQWLHAFAEAHAPRGYLRERAAGFRGPWAPTYSPPDAPPVGGALNRLGLVHGSFDPGNIMVSENGIPRLTGVIDFEATRLGSSLIDVAGLALHFLLAGDPALATRWLTAAATAWAWDGLPQVTVPYLLAQNERRRAAAAGDPAVGCLTDEALAPWLSQQGPGRSD